MCTEFVHGISARSDVGMSVLAATSTCMEGALVIVLAKTGLYA